MTSALPGDKPLDVGTGTLCASFDPRSAGCLSVGMPHGVHGFVELSALPPFDEAARGDPTATRRHRTRMTRGEHAFLVVELEGAPARLDADPSEPDGPQRWLGHGIDVRARASADGAAIEQRWAIRRFPSRSQPAVTVRVRGTVDRPALAEITELDPPTPTGARTTMRASGSTVSFDAPVLPAQAAVEIVGADVQWLEREGEVRGTVAWPEEGDLAFTVAVSLTNDLPPLRAPFGAGTRHADRLTGRALAYVRGCTALATAPDEVVILTDHRILPFSWTRDAYWQALALLVADGPSDRERVAAHLRWLWRRCERPDGRWVRSHHANGRRKDVAFQADQQLYPLVELADHWRLTGSMPDGVDWDGAVAAAWSAALDEVDPTTDLIGCVENAADDPAAAPFIGGSQILLWYAGMRIAELAEAGVLDLEPSSFVDPAAAARSAFHRRLAAPGRPWAYAVGHDGARVMYHDANDLPVALAPTWGFCPPDDAGWAATMRFAFSAANTGWVDGARPGLGSAHTAGPWTLGDVQAWLWARAIGDGDAADASLRRLHDVAFFDGMLPEAYGADDSTRVRHWFAWPGAALAALRELDARDALRDRLSAGERR